MRRDVLRTVGVTAAAAYGLFLLGFLLLPSSEDLQPAPPPDPAAIQREAEAALATRLGLETLRTVTVEDRGNITAVDVPTADVCTDAPSIAAVLIDEMAELRWEGDPVSLTVSSPRMTVNWAGAATTGREQFESMVDTVCALPPELVTYVAYRDGVVDLYPADSGAVSAEMAAQARAVIFDAGLRPSVWMWEYAETVAVTVEP